VRTSLLCRVVGCQRSSVRLRTRLRCWVHCPHGAAVIETAALGTLPPWHLRQGRGAPGTLHHEHGSRGSRCAVYNEPIARPPLTGRGGHTAPIERISVRSQWGQVTRACNARGLPLAHTPCHWFCGDDPRAVFKARNAEGRLGFPRRPSLFRPEKTREMPPTSYPPDPGPGAHSARDKGRSPDNLSS
jgi:hypothetical protein